MGLERNKYLLAILATKFLQNLNENLVVTSFAIVLCYHFEIPSSFVNVNHFTRHKILFKSNCSNALSHS